MSRASDLKKIFKSMEPGFTVELTSAGHHEVRGPDGKKVATLSGTGGRGRGDMNALAALRRAKAIKR